MFPQGVDEGHSRFPKRACFSGQLLVGSLFSDVPFSLRLYCYCFILQMDRFTSADDDVEMDGPAAASEGIVAKKCVPRDKGSVAYVGS